MRIQRKYIMGGFILPVKRECATIGASGYVNVVDARGRIIKRFKSTQLADSLVSNLNNKGKE